MLAGLFVAATFAASACRAANFWGELTIFVALWKFSPLITALAVAGVVISAVYDLARRPAVFGRPPIG